MRYTHYDEHKKRWQINDDYGAVMIDELNYAVGEAVDKLAAYEDAGLEPEQIKELNNGIIPEHWAELYKAECEGRLIVLPCKVGDTVYRPLYGKIWEGVVLNFSFGETVSASIQNVTGGAIVFEHKEDFGKTVFLTREAAEAALKGEPEDV